MPCRGWAMGPFRPMLGMMGMGPGMCPGPAFCYWPGRYPYRDDQQLREYADQLRSELARVEEAIRELGKWQV